MRKVLNKHRYQQIKSLFYGSYSHDYKLLQNRKCHGKKELLTKRSKSNLHQHLWINFGQKCLVSLFKRFFNSWQFSIFQTYHSCLHLHPQFLLQHHWCSRDSSSLLVTSSFHWQGFWKASLLKLSFCDKIIKKWVIEKKK